MIQEIRIPVIYHTYKNYFELATNYTRIFIELKILLKKNIANSFDTEPKNINFEVKKFHIDFSWHPNSTEYFAFITINTEAYDNLSVDLSELFSTGLFNNLARLYTSEYKTTDMNFAIICYDIISDKNFIASLCGAIKKVAFNMVLLGAEYTGFSIKYKDLNLDNINIRGFKRDNFDFKNYNKITLNSVYGLFVSDTLNKSQKNIGSRILLNK